MIYYVLEEHKTPLKKVVFQSKIKGRVQLGAEKASNMLTPIGSVQMLPAVQSRF